MESNIFASFINGEEPVSVFEYAGCVDTAKKEIDAETGVDALTQILDGVHVEYKLLHEFPAAPKRVTDIMVRWNAAEVLYERFTLINPETVCVFRDVLVMKLFEVGIELHYVWPSHLEEGDPEAQSQNILTVLVGEDTTVAMTCVDAHAQPPAHVKGVFDLIRCEASFIAFDYNAESNCVYVRWVDAQEGEAFDTYIRYELSSLEEQQSFLEECRRRLATPHGYHLEWYWPTKKGAY